MSSSMGRFVCDNKVHLIRSFVIIVLVLVLSGAYVTASTETTDDYNGEGDGGGDGSANRIGMGGPPCSKDDILIFQGATTPLPSGIPTYTVEIENVCLSGGNCAISNIHLSCGWFSSARMINPAIFRRIAYDDCLVNDGQPLNPGQVITFQYADSFEYPMSVSSVSC